MAVVGLHHRSGEGPYKTIALDQAELQAHVTIIKSSIIIACGNMVSKKELVFEIKRQAFHLVFGVFLAFFILYLGRDVSLTLLATGIMLSVYVSRLSKKQRVPVISWFLETFERKHASPGGGLITACIGGFISLALFGAFAAFVSILLLAYVDSFSTVIGKSYGRTKLLGKKTLEGFVGGMIAGFFIASIFLPGHIAAVAAFVAAVVELLPGDDNISIPPVVGFVLSYIKP